MRFKHCAAGILPNLVQLGSAQLAPVFNALMTAGAETGQGVVIMINANDNSRMVGQILNAVAAHYKSARQCCE